MRDTAIERRSLVALYVSAWIEIEVAELINSVNVVALYVSAWIEI